MILKPVCFKCHRFYFPEKNGFHFTEGMPEGDRVKPGLAEPDRWKPYKIWVGDLWRCEGCGHQLIVGVCGGPICEHYMPQFTALAKRLGSDKYQVNDC